KVRIVEHDREEPTGLRKRSCSNTSQAPQPTASEDGSIQRRGFDRNCVVQCAAVGRKIARATHAPDQRNVATLPPRHRGGLASRKARAGPPAAPASAVTGRRDGGLRRWHL